MFTGNLMVNFIFQLQGGIGYKNISVTFRKYCFMPYHLVPEMWNFMSSFLQTQSQQIPLCLFLSICLVLFYHFTIIILVVDQYRLQNNHVCVYRGTIKIIVVYLTIWKACNFHNNRDSRDYVLTTLNT